MDLQLYRIGEFIDCLKKYRDLSPLDVDPLIDKLRQKKSDLERQRTTYRFSPVSPTSRSPTRRMSRSRSPSPRSYSYEEDIFEFE